MFPALYAMPRFPYGRATFPPNTQPVFGADELAPLEPLAPPPLTPASLPGKLHLGIGITGALVAAMGWSLGNSLMMTAGTAGLVFGVLMYPYGQLARYTGVAGVAGVGYGH